jgi:ubiquinone/menaquinone biosynthesis C-methylase UbiE
MDDDLVKYYRLRAEEYEVVYDWRDPHRQEEQDLMKVQMKKALKGRKVIDIACGTGYWTYVVSMVAKSIIGIDLAQETIDLAETKKYGCPTIFMTANAYKLPFRNESFNGVLTSFWFSHIPKAKISDWIIEIHRVMKPNSHIFIADNTYITGLGGPLLTKSNTTDTYKLRTLRGGSQHLIIKNYFTIEEIVTIFSSHTKELSERNVFYGNCFWWLHYKLKKI